MSANEVNEAIAYIALVFYVAWQIKKVISVRKMQIDFLSQFFDRVFVRNISDHDSCSRIKKNLFHFQNVKASLFKVFIAVGIVVGRVVIVISKIVVEVGGDYIHSTSMTFL